MSSGKQFYAVREKIREALLLKTSFFKICPTFTIQFFTCFYSSWLHPYFVLFARIESAPILNAVYTVHTYLCPSDYPTSAPCPSTNPPPQSLQPTPTYPTAELINGACIS